MLKEQITQELEKLPEPLLQEILDFSQKKYIFRDMSENKCRDIALLRFYKDSR